MLATLKTLGVRLYFACIQLVDSVASIFGYQIFKINYENIFNGLSYEEVQAAKDPSIVKPLDLYIEGYKGADQLGVLQRFHHLATLKNTLRKRAGIQRAIQDNPDVLNTPIKRPIFIIGFPRTGTTMLYNLLAQDPQFKAPMFWEMITPYPPGRPDNWRECERFTNVRDLLELRRAVGEGSFDVAHELRVDNPEECLFALGRNFLQYYYHLRFPSFKKVSDWYYSLTKEELVEAYRHYKKTLQCIGYKGLDDHQLLLKAHVHLLKLDALLEVFPDACLIFTYRPMTEVLPSFCSTIYKGTEGWGPQDDQFGKRVVKMVGEYANRAVQVMKDYEGQPKEKQPFYNVEYKEMVKNPIEIIRGIYDQYGINFSQEAEQRMRNWLDNNKQHKHGRHRYSMEEYGLTEDDIKSNMGPYLDYFKSQSNNLI